MHKIVKLVRGLFYIWADGVVSGDQVVDFMLDSRDCCSSHWLSVKTQKSDPAVKENRTQNEVK
ncbi:hypothetical protein DL897_17655 [Thermoflavimicrobium daqui]|uniref:Uncharacterized protein n=1 Tax=Thermoflavimicrobium daqui TaxID=2137476 RepID=A0A364K0F4_9BACL|nr:hypothetical protein DL897_17655 [Thermoflavimicrobium daqui]